MSVAKTAIHFATETSLECADGSVFLEMAAGSASAAGCPSSYGGGGVSVVVCPPSPRPVNNSVGKPTNEVSPSLNASITLIDT